MAGILWNDKQSCGKEQQILGNNKQSCGSYKRILKKDKQILESDKQKGRGPQLPSPFLYCSDGANNAGDPPLPLVLEQVQEVRFSGEAEKKKGSRNSPKCLTISRTP